MSLIKRQKTCFSSYSQNRDSFSERICDDLCEVILQYLSLEDKLRLECVSEQFRRSIFQKYYELTIDSETALIKNNSFNLKSFESLLKKCPNTKSVHLNFSDYDFPFDNYNEFIHLITKYCNNLVEFKSPFCDISVSAYEEFHNKFGSKLKFFKPPKYMTHFPNLKELIVEMSTEQLELISKLKFEKLESLSVVVDGIEEAELINQLFDNSPSIQYLDIQSIQQDMNMSRVMRAIAKLKQLIHLRIFITYGRSLNNEMFSDSVKEIAIECQKLKSIEYDIASLNSEGFKLRQMSPLKQFKQLKRLCLNVLSRKYYGNSDDNPFSVNAFEGLSNLTHLTLFFWETFELKANALINIEKYLPNLQYLEFSNISGEQESSQIADILSPLSKLKTIKIRSRSESFCRIIGEEISRKCPQTNTYCSVFKRNKIY